MRNLATFPCWLEREKLVDKTADEDEVKEECMDSVAVD